jgi:hypothetical protein
MPCQQAGSEGAGGDDDTEGEGADAEDVWEAGATATRGALSVADDDLCAGGGRGDIHT